MGPKETRPWWRRRILKLPVYVWTLLVVLIVIGGLLGDDADIEDQRRTTPASSNERDTSEQVEDAEESVDVRYVLTLGFRFGRDAWEADSNRLCTISAGSAEQLDIKWTQTDQTVEITYLDVGGRAGEIVNQAGEPDGSGEYCADVAVIYPDSADPIDVQVRFGSGAPTSLENLVPYSVPIADPAPYQYAAHLSVDPATGGVVLESE